MTGMRSASTDHPKDQTNRLPAAQAGAVRIVMIGDVVGKPGMRITCDSVPWLKSVVKADAIVVNAENAADGSGLRCKDYRRLIEHGVDAITLGDHVFRKREIMEVLEREANIVRPANLAAEAPGKTHVVIPIGDRAQMLVTCALGRVFMNPVDCPFHAIDRELERVAPDVKIALVDFHAEATSDMQLMGRYLDGRVTAVLGTHTHVATADEQIFQGGTGFQSDVGMTGPYESILGRKIDAVMEATLKSIPTPFQVATGDVRLSGTWFDADIDSGKCLAIGRLCIPESTISAFQKQAETTRKTL